MREKWKSISIAKPYIRALSDYKFGKTYFLKITEYDTNFFSILFFNNKICQLVILTLITVINVFVFNNNNNKFCLK